MQNKKKLRKLISDGGFFKSEIFFFVCMTAVNNVTLLGRVGADPQKRGTTEHPLVIFSLATHTNYKYETGI